MNPLPPLDPRLLETLSAYLDGRLEGAEKSALEERLRREEDLRRQLSELRAVRDSLRALPVLKPPRALTLTPAQAGTAVRKPGGVSSRWMAFGSALAALAFVIVSYAEIFPQGFFAMGATQRVAAPAANPVLESAMTAEAPPQDKAAAGFGAEPTAAAPEPTGTCPSAALATGGCGECTPNAAEVGPLRSVNEFFQPPAPERISIPDFKTLAPYLMGFFGLSAVVLAVLAVVFRRNR